MGKSEDFKVGKFHSLLPTNEAEIFDPNISSVKVKYMMHFLAVVGFYFVSVFSFCLQFIFRIDPDAIFVLFLSNNDVNKSMLQSKQTIEL